MPRGKATEDAGEMIGYVENGGFIGINDHEMITEPLKVSVNKPLTGLATEHSQRIHGERIEIWKKKMGANINPQGEMSAVKKEWKGIQKPLNGDESEMATPTRYKPIEDDSDYPSQPSGKDMSPLAVLKNMVDNHANDIRNWGNWTKLNLILATVGVCGFIVALATMLK